MFWNYCSAAGSYNNTTNPWIVGDLTFTGSSSTAGGVYNGHSGKLYYGYYAVLKHGVPGFLVESYDHTYQPAVHRALNPDMEFIEGMAYARGINDYFGWGVKESHGYILGVVRDKDERMSHAYYDACTNTVDDYKPLNNVVVHLKKNGNIVRTYVTDNKWNGVFMFRDLEPGNYTITYSKSGYTTLSDVAVTVTANKNTYINNQLSKAADYVPPTGTVKSYSYAFHDPSDWWVDIASDYSGAPNNLYIQAAVTDGAFFTVPQHGSTSGWTSTYYTMGYKIASSVNQTWSGGNLGAAFPSDLLGEGGYFYLGPAIASDAEGTLFSAAHRYSSAHVDGWARPTVGVVAYTSRPANGVMGTRSCIDISDYAPSARTDYMSAYGRCINETGYFWYAPTGTAAVERVTLTKGVATDKNVFQTPGGVASSDARAYVMQYADNKVMYANSNTSNGNAVMIYKGVINDKTINWTSTGCSSYSSQSTMFELGNCEFVAYSSSTTHVTIYNLTKGEELITIKPFGTASSNAYVRHSLHAKVNADKTSAEFYIYVPGVAAAKYSISATPTEVVVEVDNEKPVIERTLTVKNNDASFYVYAYARDNVGVTSVKFPTWTTLNGQDDLAKTWPEGESGNWLVDGVNYNYRYLVKTSDHNNETGEYITHVYAYDAAGNSLAVGTSFSFEKDPVQNLSVKIVKDQDAAQMGRQDAVVSWTAPASGTVSKYSVYYSTKTSAENNGNWSEWTLAGTTAGTSYTHQDVKWLVQGENTYERSYKYQVIPNYASGSVGNTAESAAVTPESIWQSAQISLSVDVEYKSPYDYANINPGGDILRLNAVATWYEVAGFGDEEGTNYYYDIDSYNVKLYDEANNLVKEIVVDVDNATGEPVAMDGLTYSSTSISRAVSETIYTYNYTFADVNPQESYTATVTTNYVGISNTTTGESPKSATAQAQDSNYYVGVPVSGKVGVKQTTIWADWNGNGAGSDYANMDADDGYWYDYQVSMVVNNPDFGTALVQPRSYYYISTNLDNEGGNDDHVMEFYLYNTTTQVYDLVTNGQIPGDYDFDSVPSDISCIYWHEKDYIGYDTNGTGTLNPALATDPVTNPATRTYVVNAVYAGGNAKIRTVESSNLEPSMVPTEVEAVESGAMLTIYPVPAQTSITIKSPEAIETIELYTESGAIIRKEQGEGAYVMTLNVSDLATGYYIIRVNNLAPVKIMKK